MWSIGRTFDAQMKYPPFLAEMGEDARRRDLLLGIWSGYGLAACFTALATIAWLEGLIPRTDALYALVLAKLVTNTLALLCWRSRRAVLETGGLNVFMDVIVMTGAIYATGGQRSPLFSMYVIEISVVAMLTNVGVTALVAGGAFVCYASMASMIHWGVLRNVPPPAQSLQLSTRYVITDICFAMFLIGLLTFYTSVILRRLRDKEKALQTKARELVDAGQQKSQFMANITHELRTPIHGVVGLAELMDSEVYGPITDKQRGALESITRSAEGLLALIDDLLHLARADAGKVEYKPSTVNIEETISGVVATCRWMLGTKRVNIQTSIAPQLPDIETDRAKLVQVVVNLLSNAIKFTPEGGSIHVRARQPSPETIAIEVEDTGIGIPASEIEQIFDPFRQVDGSSSRRFGGAGLGLALVKHLAGVLGGNVVVKSVEGAGSTFTVTIPMRHVSATAAA